jgi:hypothetical protein
LKSLGREIRGFRGIVCFQWLNYVFVSRSRRMRFFQRKKAGPAAAKHPFHKLRAGFRQTQGRRLTARPCATESYPTLPKNVDLFLFFLFFY